MVFGCMRLLGNSFLRSRLRKSIAKSLRSFLVYMAAFQPHVEIHGLNRFHCRFIDMFWATCRGSGHEGLRLGLSSQQKHSTIELSTFAATVPTLLQAKILIKQIELRSASLASAIQAWFIHFVIFKERTNSVDG